MDDDRTPAAQVPDPAIRDSVVDVLLRLRFVRRRPLPHGGRLTVGALVIREPWATGIFETIAIEKLDQAVNGLIPPKIANSKYFQKQSTS